MASFNLYFFLFLILILIQYADTTETPPPTPTPTPTPPITEKTPFKPGISVVVGVLTTMFSLTFLFLLYIKHCNTTAVNIQPNNITANSTSSRGVPPFTTRKNSGVDRSVIESLPVFRFGSLMGQKDGLDCAVCLTRFEASELLRLLPKCKHAFHVECVDTWLDAHSTCPLCRYQVDPEDILLLRETKTEQHLDLEKGRNSSQIEDSETRRISGRHSSVGEREGGRRLQTASFRRSLDSATARKKNENGVVGVGVGCFVRPRKDGMLLLTRGETESVERRLEHRIIVSPSLKPRDQRWSDVQPSDLLYLMSEMIIRREEQKKKNDDEDSWNGRGIINSRSVSEITGVSRFLNTAEGERQHQHQRNREEGLVSRWLAWISISKSHSQPQPQPPVR